MIVTLKWAYADGSFDTKTLKLVCIPGRNNAFHKEREAEISIADGMNLVCGSIDLGKTQVEDANKLCQEIVRRFNEFPEEGKL